MEKHINLETLAGGAFSEKINQAFKEVIKNIKDPNTEASAKRKITTTITFSPGENRDLSNLDIISKTTLTPKKGIHTTILFGDDANGEIVAAEYKKQIPGQQAVTVDTETGEIVGNDSKKEKNTDGLKVIRS